MALGRPTVALIPTADERVRLESLAHRSRTAPHVARLARIILACAEESDSTSGRVTYCAVRHQRFG
ncbi:MAG TPA: hypothetical protein VGF24_07100 [Vicinamibacterales bacterium]|jgi:hypothetical protein